ncbi:extensin family protein [Chelativorans sp. AA-79]|uniref:extensin-like domain-containing protein n=1 Tax=Chelativorans sp. AA-79 TaxID=3028735 RepID=UPI0023F9DE99|nr:extensin family protein [Chelativorans sp. AA-79]WEX11184.1 extensin family protein [Chelativorans sp. AA-79]
MPQSRTDALRQETPVPRPAPDGLPAAERACRKELRKLGVKFKESPAVAAPGGCSLPFPIEVARLSRAIRIESPATLDCGTVLAAARFFQTAGMTLAEKHFGTGIATVEQASGYVCRPINGADDLSQHAFGKALDVSGVVLADGTQIEVRDHGGRGEAARFLKDLRAAACGPFSTVLGPGTDAHHADHFHFDIKERRTPYCR